MSWKIAIAVALFTAVITAIVTAPVADKVAKIQGVSNFEGGRHMAVAFFFIPAGFIGGLLLGLLGAKLMHATEWAHFWKAAGVSVLLGQVLLFSILGLSSLSIPRSPLMEGHRLALEMEVLVPIARITPRSKEPGQIKMSLYAGEKDNNYAVVDPTRFREENGMLIVPALANLNSTTTGRSISFHLDKDTWLALDLLLPAVPNKIDMEWSEPMPLRDARVAGPTSAISDVLLRYRVVEAASQQQ